MDELQSGATQDVQEVPQSQEPIAEQEQNGPSEAVWGDEFDEEAIGRMFDAQYGDDDAEPKSEPQDQEQIEEQEEAEEEQPEEPEKKEQDKEDGDDDTYKLTIDGKEVDMTGDELHEAVETAMRFNQHKEELGRAVHLAQAVRNDPKLQEILVAYGKGEVPAMYAQAQQQALNVPDFDKMPAEQQQGLTQLAGMLGPHFEKMIVTKAMEQMQAWAQPFVDNVNNFANGIQQERAFAKYTSDPDHAEFTQSLRQGVAAEIEAGRISTAQAAKLSQDLARDPKRYGEFFKAFKDAKKKQATSQRVVSKKSAPKVDGGSAAQMESRAMKGRAAMQSYLDSGGEDANALGVLFGD